MTGVQTCALPIFRSFLSAHEAVALFAAAAVFAVVRNLPGMWVYLGPLLGPAG